MEADVSYRHASAKDADFAWNLYSKTTRPQIEPFLKGPWTDADQRRAFESWWKPENCLVIMSGQDSVGWITFNAKSDQLELEHLCIEPSHQGKGIAASSIQHVIGHYNTKNHPVSAAVLKSSPLLSHLQDHGFNVVPQEADDLTVRLLKP